MIGPNETVGPPDREPAQHPPSQPGHARDLGDTGDTEGTGGPQSPPGSEHARTAPADLGPGEQPAADPSPGGSPDDAAPGSFEADPAAQARAGEDVDWDPTGLDLARSVVGSLVNGARNGGGSRPGTGAAGSGRRGRSTYGSGSRARRDGAGVVGESAYADLAGTSGAHPDDRDPQALDDTIGRLVADRGWNTEVAVAGAFSRWDQIVGSEIAQHCRAERYADGVLTVRADSTAWATQVRLLAATLVKRLNEDLGDGTVHRIVVHGPTGYDWRKGGLGTRDARGPRDTFG